jgi:hypothetical protein
MIGKNKNYLQSDQLVGLVASTLSFSLASQLVGSLVLLSGGPQADLVKTKHEWSVIQTLAM